MGFSRSLASAAIFQPSFKAPELPSVSFYKMDANRERTEARTRRQHLAILVCRHVQHNTFMCCCTKRLLPSLLFFVVLVCFCADFLSYFWSKRSARAKDFGKLSRATSASSVEQLRQAQSSNFGELSRAVQLGLALTWPQKCGITLREHEYSASPYSRRRQR